MHDSFWAVLLPCNLVCSIVAGKNVARIDILVRIVWVSCKVRRLIGFIWGCFSNSLAFFAQGHNTKMVLHYVRLFIPSLTEGAGLPPGCLTFYCMRVMTRECDFFPLYLAFFQAAFLKRRPSAKHRCGIPIKPFRSSFSDPPRGNISKVSERRYINAMKTVARVRTATVLYGVQHTSGAPMMPHTTRKLAWSGR